MRMTLRGRSYPGERVAARQRAARWAGAVGLAYPVTVGLCFALGLRGLHPFLLPWLVVALPLLAIAQVPLVQDAMALGRPLERTSVYAGSAVFVLLMGTLAVAASIRSPGLASLGVRRMAPEALLAWSLGLLMVTLGLVALWRSVGRALGWRESAITRALLPRTIAERRLFAALSVAAGLGEELAYRGYVLTLMSYVGAGGLVGAAVSSIPFAAVHAYQGWSGAVRAGLLGFVFGVVVLLTGSVWPAVLAHAGLDLLAGLWLGRWLVAAP